MTKSSVSPGRMNGTSDQSLLSNTKPFVYSKEEFGGLAKKPQYRDLYSEHYLNAREEATTFANSYGGRITREGKKVAKYKELAEFVEVTMQTAVQVDYDRNKTLDENFKEFSDLKKMMDESDM